MKNCFISGQFIILLKNLRQLNTIESYYGSSEALAHSGQIWEQNYLIG